MRKIVDNILYDTDNAELIYTDVSNNRRLWKTHKGNYFIAYPNGTIQPKSEKDVKAYLGDKDADAYIREFGKPEEA